MKKIKENLGNVLIAIAEAAVGVLLLVEPVSFTSTIITILGVLLVIGGVGKIIGYFRATPVAGIISQALTEGILMVILGLFCTFRSQWFIATFPALTILYGISTLVWGVNKLSVMIDWLRLRNKDVLWCGISAAVSIVCAVIILMNPFTSTAVLWVFIAISLIVEAVMDILSIIFTKEKSNRRVIS